MEKKTIFDLHRVTVDEYRSADKMPVVLVVDNVRSLNNIGSLFRTSDAFAVERIVLCGISAVPPSAEIHKTALGAEDSVAWSYTESTLDAVEQLQAQGVTVCCLEQVKGSIELQEYRPEAGKRYAVVIGNEVDGVQPSVVDASDVCLEIPQRGTKHSLNVSVSAGLALWHFFEAYIKQC